MQRIANPSSGYRCTGSSPVLSATYKKPSERAVFLVKRKLGLEPVRFGADSWRARFKEAQALRREEDPIYREYPVLYFPPLIKNRPRGRFF